MFFQLVRTNKSREFVRQFLKFARNLISKLNVRVSTFPLVFVLFFLCKGFAVREENVIEKVTVRLYWLHSE